MFLATCLTSLDRVKVNHAHFTQYSIYSHYTLSSLFAPVHAQKPASKQKHTMIIHKDTREDPYYWMRLSDEQKSATKPDAHTQKVLDYIQQENTHTKKQLQHTEKLQALLFKEMTARLQKDKSSVPYEFQGYQYYSKYKAGKEYQIHYRKALTAHATLEVLLDENKMAQGHKYFRLGAWQVSPDQQWIAYTTDVIGRRQYTLHFKNLKTNEILSESVKGVTGPIAWASDNQHIFYTTSNATTLLSEKVWRHKINTSVKQDQMVYHEKDTSFYIGVSRSKSGKFIVIWNQSTTTSDYQILPSDQPLAPFKSFTPRLKDHRYKILHTDQKFYILSNHQALNNRLMYVDDQNTQQKHWKEMIAHRSDVHLLSMDFFRDDLVIHERKDGNKNLRLINFTTQQDRFIQLPESVCDVMLSRDNKDPQSQKVRYSYSSLTTPNSVFDYDIKTQKSTLLKQDKVLGGFDAKNYQSQRIYIKARDGHTVPVSLVYRKDLRQKGIQNLLLYGYGSYGYTIDPYFSITRLSLLDRGFIFAIAHVRGGQIYGRTSYEDGKLLNKKNTFHDFIDAAQALIKQKYTDEEHLFAMGGSAGGLLMGVIANQAPHLWKGVISMVPFVDVVTTMLDETIPLTTNEWDEWGNPKQKKYYDYMLS